MRRSKAHSIRLARELRKELMILISILEQPGPATPAQMKSAAIFEQARTLDYSLQALLRRQS